MHRLSILKQLSIELRRIRHDLITLYKILHGMVDSSLKSLFVLATDMSTCSHTLRGHVFKLFLSKPRTDMLKYGFVYRVIKVWNSLSQTECESGTLSMLKLS